MISQSRQIRRIGTYTCQLSKILRAVLSPYSKSVKHYIHSYPYFESISDTLSQL